MEVSPEYIRQQIDKAIAGDQIAYNFLLNHFWNDVYGFQLKRVKNEYEAEDITIEAFSKAFDKLDTFNPDYTFKTWLITISKNVHIDKIRKNKIDLNLDLSAQETNRIERLADPNPTPEDKLITEQNLAQLLRFIKQLKPHYQEIINLRYFQEKSYNEIATELDESLSNVKVKLLRAKNLLADIINNNQA